MDGDDDDEYERARQEQIKQNRDLLEKLGLNATTVRIRSPSPPRPPPVARSNNASRRYKRSASDSPLGDLDHPPQRERSKRLAGKERMNYNDTELTKMIGRRGRDAPKPPPRQGTRKSGRLSGDRNSKYAEADTSDTDSDDYAPGDPSSSSYRPPRPKGPQMNHPNPRINGRDWNDEEDIFEGRAELPTRSETTGELCFEGEWSKIFRPSLTPEQVLRGGAFGGTFFKPHFSTVLRRYLDPDDDLAELPQEWIQGIDRETMLTSEELDPGVNRFKKKAGQSLSEWEKASWIIPADPRGWFQW